MLSEKSNISITPDTKVGELLNIYPELENVLIEIAPVFSKLRNPILRRTIAKVTSLKEASAVANVPLGDMINKLRSAAGQSSIETDLSDVWYNKDAGDMNTPVITYDAREDLERGIHPIGKVMTDLSKLNSGETYLLVTPFTPAPLIDRAKDKGLKAVSRKVSNDRFETYFSKE